MGLEDEIPNLCLHVRSAALQCLPEGSNVLITPHPSKTSPGHATSLMIVASTERDQPDIDIKKLQELLGGEPLRRNAFDCRVGGIPFTVEVVNLSAEPRQSTL